MLSPFLTVLSSQAQFSWRPRIVFPNGMTWLPLRVMVALESYYCQPNMLRTPKITTVKIMKGIIRWKVHFVDLMEDAKSQGFSASFESDGMTSRKHLLTTWPLRPPKSNFGHFFRIAGTVEALWQTPMLTTCWWGQKNKLFVVTFSVKVPVSSSSSDWTGGSSLQLVFRCGKMFQSPLSSSSHWTGGSSLQLVFWCI